jgi:hypothetical protein
LRFLYVYSLAGLCGSDKQVCLSAQEGWNLYDITNFSDWLSLMTLMYVCQYAQIVFALDVGQQL